MAVPTPLALLAAAALAAAGPRAARGDDGGSAAPLPEQVRASALALLGGIDRPVPADAFRQLGPGVDAALEDIARSGELPLYRARALEALALLGSPRAAEVDRALAADPAAPRTVRRAAVRGLGRVAAEAARGELRALLEGDPDPAVRAAAAESLAGGAPRASCGAIRAQALREDPADRLRFRRALAACERR